MTTHYLKPNTLDEAIRMYCAAAGPVHYFAGGTDLMVKQQVSETSTRTFISLDNLPDLNGIREQSDKKIVIGAMTRLSTVADSTMLVEHFPALATAAGSVGSPSIRNMGTIGGNVCNASPSADTAPPLLVYNAMAVVRGPEAERTVPMDTFFSSPSTTCLKTGEILIGFILEKSPGICACFVKFGGRKAMECSIVNLSIALATDISGICRTVRIALGAVAPTPMRARKAEKMLTEQTLDENILDRVAESVADEIRPIDDHRSTAVFRKRMAGHMVREALSGMRS